MIIIGKIFHWCDSGGTQRLLQTQESYLVNNKYLFTWNPTNTFAIIVYFSTNIIHQLDRKSKYSGKENRIEIMRVHYSSVKMKWSFDILFLTIVVFWRALKCKWLNHSEFPQTGLMMIHVFSVMFVNNRDYQFKE